MSDNKPRAHYLVGMRLEIPVHFDLWMQGARFGKVTSAAKDGSEILVKMDHPQVKNRVKIREADFDNCRFEGEEQRVYRSREFAADHAPEGAPARKMVILPADPHVPGPIEDAGPQPG